MDLGVLFRKHHVATVYWMAGRIRRSGVEKYDGARDRAEECVQTAWLQLIARGVQPQDRYPGLLMKVAYRAFGEQLRKAKVDRENARLKMPREEVEMGWGAQLCPALEKPVAVLPPAKLEAWMLRQQGLSLKEIAAEMELAHDHAAAALLSKANAVLKAA